MKLPIPTTGRNKQILYCKYYRIGQSSYERVTINIRKNVKLSEIKEMNRNISFIFSVIDEGGYLSLLSEDVMFSYTKKDFCNKEIILFEKDYNPTKITFVLLFIKCYPEEECIKLLYTTQKIIIITLNYLNLLSFLSTQKRLQMSSLHQFVIFYI